MAMDGMANSRVKGVLLLAEWPQMPTVGIWLHLAMSDVLNTSMGLQYPPYNLFKLRGKKLQGGHFIWCTICHDYNIDGCRDKPHLCSPHEDVCVFERKRSIYNGEDEVEIIKRCGKSSECNRAGSIRSLTKTILINTTCCDQSLCDSPLPSFPVTNNDTNGVICPACFVPNSDRCLGRSDLKCIGNEKRCIHYKRAEKQDLYIVTESLHGCTTDEVCEAGSSLLLPNGVHYKTIKTDIACNNAITHRTESYPFLLLTVTALSVLKVEM
uniref:UPAR/Ly6 domain-containing protein n=1 Tax=Pyxicephalus adspersus TaxID=30357 RepID=A0AAV3A123_PYXAD|nr:TPA: hypothetical protein GDO54_003292 [Pyxicephalus adspersus]